MAETDGRRAVLGVLLAGGLARRMGGGDKPLVTVGGRSMLQRAIDVLGPQCSALVINANGDPARFGELGLPVIADGVADYPGPLAGVLAGMDWCARNRPDIDWIATVAADSPFLPGDFVARLQNARAEADADLAVARSAGQAHPVNALWRVSLREDLRRALVEEEVRKIDVWTARHRLVPVDWDVEPVDPFFNANRPEEVAEAERLAREYGL